MQKLKKHLPLAVIVGILFVTGLVFSHSSIALGDEESDSSTSATSGGERDGGDNHNSTSYNRDKSDESDNQSDNNDNQDEHKSTTESRTTKTRAGITQTARIRQQESDNNQGDNADEQNGDNNDIKGELADVSNKIAKLEAKMAPLATTDPKAFEAFSASLKEIKDLLAQANGLVANDPKQAEALIETIDHKMERLGNMVEVDEENDNEQAKESDNEDVAKQYKNTVAQFVHTLKAVGESDNGELKGIGQQVKVVAQAQNDAQPEVENSINSVEQRNGFVKFLIGPNYGSIKDIQSAITANQARVNALSSIMGQVSDPVAKQVLQQQLVSMQQQNDKLQQFVTANEGGASLLGWLVKLFY
ncbi:MAG TPA: hypothetical protein VF817_04260 [Patescibacteria group bacterium]